MRANVSEMVQHRVQLENRFSWRYNYSDSAWKPSSYAIVWICFFFSNAKNLFVFQMFKWKKEKKKRVKNKTIKREPTHILFVDLVKSKPTLKHVHCAIAFIHIVAVACKLQAYMFGFRFTQFHAQSPIAFYFLLPPFACGGVWFTSFVEWSMQLCA